MAHLLRWSLKKFFWGEKNSWDFSLFLNQFLIPVLGVSKLGTALPRPHANFYLLRDNSVSNRKMWKLLCFLLSMAEGLRRSGEGVFISAARFSFSRPQTAKTPAPPNFNRFFFLRRPSWRKAEHVSSKSSPLRFGVPSFPFHAGTPNETSRLRSLLSCSWPALLF